jgi:Protein of unknown function (DUF3141)
VGFPAAAERSSRSIAIEVSEDSLDLRRSVAIFEYETVLDGRTLARPVNYALVRIVPPDGVRTDESLRPYLIVDPRAGHGPGIGGFKQESQVGVALRAGYPVSFVIFLPDPVPGQTIRDVVAAQARFVEEVAARHPDSSKPVVFGNCRAGGRSCSCPPRARS